MSDHKARVLVVDDEEGIRDAVKRLILKCADVEIDEAATGLEALECLSVSKYDLLITDLSMPEMDGSSLMDAVMRRHPTVKMILLTAFGSEPLKEELKEKGVRYQLIKKPFTKDELLGPVKAVLQEIDADASRTNVGWLG